MLALYFGVSKRHGPWNNRSQMEGMPRYGPGMAQDSPDLRGLLDQSGHTSLAQQASGLKAVQEARDGVQGASWFCSPSAVRKRPRRGWQEGRVASKR